MDYEKLTPYRKVVVDRIKEYEREGLWAKDVEDDPPFETLMPDRADYLNEKPFAKLKSRIANRLAIRFYEGLIKKGAFIIKDVRGMENYTAVKGGAILTCNHFSMFDNYVVYRTIRRNLGKSGVLYKVIREGNYTGFKGLFGFFFRHCNTLPLSSNTDTMKKFLRSVDILLNRGEKILVYPEQGMWWNYRKPRPMQNGAFKLAEKSNVPVIPVFITMEDTEKLDADGYPIQAYTVHFAPAIYPDKSLSPKDATEKLKEENYRICKEIYEREYGLALNYEE